LDGATRTAVTQVRAKGHSPDVQVDISDLEDVQYIYLVKDHLGSPMATVGDNGTTTTRFNPWGLMTQPTGVAKDLNDAKKIENTRGFTGHETIASANLIHMNGRVYDPLDGFTSPDPVLFKSNIVSHNRYAYGLNSSPNYVDVSGFMPAEYGRTAFIRELIGQAGEQAYAEHLPANYSSLDQQLQAEASARANRARVTARNRATRRYNAMHARGERLPDFVKVKRLRYTTIREAPSVAYQRAYNLARQEGSIIHPYEDPPVRAAAAAAPVAPVAAPHVVDESIFNADPHRFVNPTYRTPRSDFYHLYHEPLPGAGAAHMAAPAQNPLDVLATAASTVTPLPDPFSLLIDASNQNQMDLLVDAAHRARFDDWWRANVRPRSRP